MSNKFLFFLIFVAFLKVNPPLNASSDHSSCVYSDSCDLPVPDSFRVIQTGIDYAILGWVPAHPDDLQSMDVDKQNASGGWDILFSDLVVNGNNYTLDDLDEGRYRVRLATICEDGSVSKNIGEAFIDIKIIDLATGGRIPLEPKTVLECNPLPLASNWVGFKLSEVGTANFNYFEFKPHSEIEINDELMRTFHPPIVAVNQLGAFPTLNGQKLLAGVPFLCQDIKGPLPEDRIDIGYVSIFIHDPSPNMIKFCILPIYNGIPWNPNYSLTPIYAEKIGYPGGETLVRPLKDLVVANASENSEEYSEPLMSVNPNESIHPVYTIKNPITDNIRVVVV